MDITQALAFVDERLRETGGCRDGTHSISHTERNHRGIRIIQSYCC